MTKYSITDPRWPGNLVGGLFFLGPIALVLYVWLMSIHPFPDRWLSIVFYYAVICGLVGAAVTICYIGFTYRWTEISESGLVVHEGYYGLFWRDRAVLKSQIAAIERYDRLRQGAFTHVWCSGIRIRIEGNGDIVLAESDGAGKYRQEVELVRQTLGMPDREHNVGAGPSFASPGHGKEQPS